MCPPRTSLLSCRRVHGCRVCAVFCVSNATLCVEQLSPEDGRSLFHSLHAPAVQVDRAYIAWRDGLPPGLKTLVEELAAQGLVSLRALAALDQAALAQRLPKACVRSPVSDVLSLCPPV